MPGAKVYCIGDSHVSVFLGYDILTPVWPEQLKSLLPWFQVIRLGPITAYNLCEYDTTTHGREKLEAVLQPIPKQSWIIISAGEIDCRVHLIKQAQLQNKSFDEICTIVVNRYINYVSHLKEAGYNICLLLPPPTMYKNKPDFEYPAFGTETERNKITASFNNILIKKCKELRIPAIEVFYEAITPSFETKKKYLWDGVHLSTIALPSLIGKLNIATNLNIKLPFYWLMREKLRSIKKFFTDNNF